MDTFLTKHNDLINTSLSCFDRLIFKGYLPLGYGSAMAGFLAQRNLLIKDFGRYAKLQADLIQVHARAMAEQSGRPLRYLSGAHEKEKLVDQILQEQPLQEGLICILSAVEACSSFRVASGQGRPQLQNARRKCLCYYFYYLDPFFGRLHVRLQTWFPFTVQVYLNGHDWLARSMAFEGLDFLQEDNCFVALGHPERAQQLADEFANLDWPAILKDLASRVNPLLTSLLAGMEYYWVTDQAEYSTDVLFKNEAALRPLFRQLLRQATLSFGAEDVMNFLGRKLSPQFLGRIQTSSKRRPEGSRIKHWMKENWIKMYNKAGLVLRIETVINNPYEFRVFRWGKRQGLEVRGWFPLTKGVKHLGRYREIMLASNKRYLNALAAIENPAAVHEQLEGVCEPVSYRGRRQRGLNPLRQEDLSLLKAVMRGEHCIHGLRNQDLAAALGLKQPQGATEARRQSARITRKLHLLHAHGLLAKIPHSRRWRVTARGTAVMHAAIHYRELALPETMMKEAA